MHGLIVGIITGIIAGYIASSLQKGKSSGLLINCFLGIAGGAFGGWLFGLFGLGAHNWLGEVLIAVVGAVILLWIVNKLR